MNFKIYIAILLSLIFFGKSLVLDTKLLGSILEADGIVLVNPLCKKQNAKNSEEHSLTESSSVVILSTDLLCNTPFYLLTTRWQETIKKPTFQDYSYINPAVISTYFSKNYPPPKALVI
ncbi:hypothetical protein INR75_19960 [Zunongwangia sp. SCSIO 43204]|uniref:hypothetical protein n=1 Tax=Zunongwangia sp. SCSIO 43204 TaxID=2779359 RepID=UPI001CAA1E90|nr:hypothetical protein [Zunongwangia sp. SCSIO 43204]UAB84396.1 hypothetical protein INR75_19960 [Zunongwangia sp. SCSIO 43204]